FVAMWLVGWLEDRTLAECGIALDDSAGQALVAATYEEFVRLSIVIGLACAWRRGFWHPLSGLACGAFAGLGMALEESLFYLSLSHAHGFQPLGVEGVRLFLHAALGGLAACGVGLFLAGRMTWPGTLAGWCLLAIVLHFLWDYQVGLGQAGTT